jgi:DNA-binding NtrC family response regulator
MKMRKKNVLVVTNQLSKKKSLRAWTNGEHPFDVRIVQSDETAIELCHQRRFDMVVVDETDGSINSRKLHAVLPILQKEIALLGYDGESPEQIEDNVKAIFDAKKYKRIQRMLMLEPSVTAFRNLPPFSLN